MSDLCKRLLMAGAAVRLRYRANPLVLPQGWNDYHLTIESGALALVRGHLGAGGAVISLLGVDHCLRTSVLGTGLTGPLKLHGLCEGSVLGLRMTDYRSAFSKDPELASLVGRAKCRQHEDQLRFDQALASPDTLSRLAGTLVHLGHVMGTSCPLAGGNYMGLTQGVLAAVTHFSRQTVNQDLGKLAAARLVHSERSFACVLDQNGVREAARGSELRPSQAGPSKCKLKHPESDLDCVKESAP